MELFIVFIGKLTSIELELSDLRILAFKYMKRFIRSIN